MPWQPPRDEDGKIIPHNHPNIQDADGIIRRISGHQVVADPKSPTGKRVSTAAFEPSSDDGGGLSVDIKRQIEEAGHDPKAYVTSPRWIGSVLLSAGHFRCHGLLVGTDPLPDNPFHGEVWGNIPRGMRRALLQQAEWFVAIDGVSL